MDAGQEQTARYRGGKDKFLVMTMMWLKTKRLLEAHPIWLLVAVCVIILPVHLATVGEYPAAWFDEIEILEMGRFSFFNVNPHWSVNMMPGLDGTLVPPMPYFHYLSGAVIEALYRLTGGFLCGRIFMLLSLPCCAVALYGYLRSKKVSVTAAVLVALLMLLDPNATVCAHWYRPDLWCLSFIYVAMALVVRSHKARHPYLLLIISGALSATSVFFWITSTLLLPLVVLEFILVYREKSADASVPKAFSALCCMSAGGIAVSCLFLLPLFRYIPDIIHQYFSTSELATMTTPGDAPVVATVSRVLDFIKIACRSPFVWGAALTWIAVSRKNVIHAIFFVLMIMFMISTRVYHLRMVYLMPYLFLFMAYALDCFVVHSEKKVIGFLSCVYVSVAMSFGLVVSVVAMNYAGWPEENTLKLFSEKLGSVVTKTTPKVCLIDYEHELYYAGRSLGWEMYSTTDRNLIFREPFADILAKMDAIVVTSAMSLSDKERQSVISRGFLQVAKVDMPPAATGAIKSRLAGIFYAHGYPSCEVWMKSHRDSMPEEGCTHY